MRKSLICFTIFLNGFEIIFQRWNDENDAGDKKDGAGNDRKNHPQYPDKYERNGDKDFQFAECFNLSPQF